LLCPLFTVGIAVNELKEKETTYTKLTTENIGENRNEKRA